MPTNEAAMTTVNMQLLQTISARLQQVLSCDCSTLDTYNPVTGVLVVQFLSVVDGIIPAGNVRLPLEGSPAGAALRTLAPVCLERLQDSPFAKEAVRHLTALGMQSGCWIPLISDGFAVGTITVARRSDGAFSSQEMDILFRFAYKLAALLKERLGSSTAVESQDKASGPMHYLARKESYLRPFKWP